MFTDISCHVFIFVGHDRQAEHILIQHFSAREGNHRLRLFFLECFEVLRGRARVKLALFADGEMRWDGIMGRWSLLSSFSSQPCAGLILDLESYESSTGLEPEPVSQALLATASFAMGVPLASAIILEYCLKPSLEFSGGASFRETWERPYLFPQHPP